MLGVSLVFVGFVLLLNGLQLLNVLEDKHVLPMNLFTGGVILAGVIRILVIDGKETDAYFISMQSLLFAFTYLWVAINIMFKQDGKGLGWYCLLVAVVALPTAFTMRPDNGLFVLWLMWVTLWFMYFLLLGIGKTSLTKSTGYWAVVNGVVAGCCGYLMLLNAWPWT